MYPDLAAFEAEAYGGTDRSLSIMLSTVTENALSKYVKSKLRADFQGDDRRALFRFDGIVGTFGAQTLLSYVGGWIQSDTRNDLDLIRIIRNGFAHCHKAFGFETAEVAAVCAQLVSPDDAGHFVSHGFLDKVPEDRLEAATDKNHPRTRYVMACHIVAERLLAAAQPGEYGGIRAP